jgi:hypothetical protein
VRKLVGWLAARNPFDDPRLMSLTRRILVAEEAPPSAITAATSTAAKSRNEPRRFKLLSALLVAASVLVAQFGPAVMRFDLQRET